MSPPEASTSLGHVLSRPSSHWQLSQPQAVSCTPPAFSSHWHLGLGATWALSAASLQASPPPPWDGGPAVPPHEGGRPRPVGSPGRASDSPTLLPAAVITAEVSFCVTLQLMSCYGFLRGPSSPPTRGASAGPPHTQEAGWVGRGTFTSQRRN